jgi:hypothetical protein
LGFVGPEGVPATGKYNLPPITAIDELDSKLSRPLHLVLKRPQLCSHPYLHGLHLLLRASGLVRVDGSGSNTRLAVDTDLEESWHALNPTEQYFTLLESWLHRGRADMIGERGRRWGGSMFGDCLQPWQSLRERPWHHDPKHRYGPYGLGIRELFHVALMDMFGWVEVGFPATPPQPWCPASLNLLPFGDAMFQMLAGEYFAEDGALFMGDGAPRPFGVWQPLIQPFFPEWRENLVLPPPEKREGTFVFRVALGKMWRLIAIDHRDTLDDLVGAILCAIEFDDDHLYAFSYRDHFGATCEVSHPACEEPPWTDQVRIGELPLRDGQSMALTYDFGDCWKFDVRLERVEPPAKGRPKQPRVLEKHGAAPAQYQW